jgi:hypothetical protein
MKRVFLINRLDLPPHTRNNNKSSEQAGVKIRPLDFWNRQLVGKFCGGTLCHRSCGTEAT